MKTGRESFLKMVASILNALSHLSLRPRGTLPQSRIDEITAAQGAATRSTDRLAEVLEELADKHDPFQQFAERARAARWRRREQH